jgi:hypothetical protein
MPNFLGFWRGLPRGMYCGDALQHMLGGEEPRYLLGGGSRGNSMWTLGRVDRWVRLLHRHSADVLRRFTGASLVPSR